MGLNEEGIQVIEDMRERIETMLTNLKASGYTVTEGDMCWSVSDGLKEASIGFNGNPFDLKVADPPPGEVKSPVKITLNLLVTSDHKDFAKDLRFLLRSWKI